ncbi:MAG: TonB-dependent receptor, partial [Ignavibacteriaceae bacterium]
MYKIFSPIIIILLIFFLMSITALASSGNLEGYVKDAQTGEALPGANVFLKGTGLGTATDVNGKYVIRNLPVGSYIVRASYIGYKFKESTVVIKEGLTLRQNFKLKPVGIEGKTVVVTAQASGQDAAINQQLSSIQIKNVVSSARIQELPDANAAESVGRLPGVSLVREGGEGSQVVIRGLAPQYNLVTIDGVQIPENVSSSRAVDLSMISSSMLEGIEVTKAITPDMDAAALGGTVNFKLREAKESTAGTAINLLAQGGYNDLQNKYNDYKLVGSSESRFFNSHFGLFGEINIERRNLTSNQLGASYSLNGPKLGEVNPVYLNSLNLTDVPSDRQRYGATVVMDYKLSDMKIDFMNFVSSSNTKSQSRGEAYSLTDNTHNYATTDQRNILSVITNILDVEKPFQFFTVDAKISHAYSENSSPNAITFGFGQNSVGLSNANYQRLSPQAIPSLAINDLSKTYLLNVGESSSFSRDRQLSASLDFQSNINFSQDITSVLKFGGVYKYTIRSENYVDGNGPLYQGGGNIVEQAILDAFPWMKKTV